MITREELIKSPEYWFEEAQNELFRQVMAYIEKEGITQTELASRLGVSKGYVSQILNGNFNYTLKKLIEVSLAIGIIPKIKYQAIEQEIKEDTRKINVVKYGVFSQEINSSRTHTMTLVYNSINQIVAA